MGEEVEELGDEKEIRREWKIPLPGIYPKELKSRS